MKKQLQTQKQSWTKICLALLFALTTVGLANAQNPVFLTSGDYTPPNSWSGGTATSTVAGTNYVTSVPNATGNKYFRFYSAGSAGGSSYGPTSGDQQITSGVAPVATQGGSSFAYYMNIVSASSNVVFKTTNGTPGTAKLWATEVQGTIRTITGTSQSPSSSSNVYSTQPVTITATLSGALSTGQNVYIRYSTNAFASSSSFVQMTVSGTTATGIIPGQTAGTTGTITYYVLTSGTTTPTHADADLMTINYWASSLNGGTNPSYSFTAGKAYYWVGGTAPSAAFADQANWSTAGLGGAAVGSTGTAITFTTADAWIVDGSDVSSTAGLQTGTITVTGAAANLVIGQFILQNSANFKITNLSTTRSYTVGTATSLTGTDLDIQAGSTLVVGCTGAGTSVQTLALLAANTASIAGILDIGNAVGSASLFTIGTANNATVTSTGTYKHGSTSGTFPGLVWNTGSTCEVTGIVGTAPGASFTQNYYNLIWNATGQSGSLGLGGVLTTVLGDFTMNSSNGQQVRLGSTQSVKLNVSGNFTMNGSSILGLNSGNGSDTLNVAGNVILNSGTLTPNVANNTGTPAIIIGGNLTIAGGTLDMQLAGNTAAANNGVVNLAGNFSMSSGAISKTGTATGANFNFTKSGTQTFRRTVSGTGTFSGNMNFTINNGSTVDFDTTTLSGSNLAGNFTLASGGGIVTANTNATGALTTSGANGTIQVTGTRTYNAGADYTFNGASAQVAGNGFTGGRNLTINNSGGVTLTASTNPTLTGTLNLTSGTLDINANTLTLNHATANAISLTGARAITSTGAGTLTVSTSACTISGSSTPSLSLGSTITLITSQGINFGSSMTTINGTFRINSGGFANTNAPIYGTGSTLQYNSGTTYGRSTEWSTTSGAGYPYNISLSNSTTLTVVNGSNTYKKLAGTLNVGTGSVFNITDLTSGTSGVGVEALGDIQNDGTISMNGGSNTTSQRLKCVNFTNGYTVTNGTSAAIVNLSGVAGGDLEVTGNVADNATFNANARAIFFTGTGTQTIGGNAPSTFNVDYIVSNKSTGKVQLLKNLLTEGPNGGNAITLTNTTDTLDLNGFTLTLGKATVASTISGSGVFKGSSTSSLSILGTGAFGTIKFDQTTNGTTNKLSTFTLNRTSTGSVTLGNALNATTATLTAGVVTLGSNDLTITSAITGSSSGYVVTNSTGGLKQTVPTTNTDITYPVGPTSSLYNPIILNNNGGTADVYKLVVASGTPSNVASPTTDYVKDTWTISEAVAGGSNLTVTTQWAGSDEGSTFARGSNVSTGYYNGSGTSFTILSTTVSGSNPYTTSATGVFSPADLTAGVAFVTGNFAIAAPTTQATNIAFSNFATTSMTIGWTRGNGGNVAVFVKDASGSITNPTDGVAYTASSNWNSGSPTGTQLGSSGYYCVYNGTATSVGVTNLVLGHTYYVQAFEYNGVSSTIKYYTATATNNPNNQLLYAAPSVTTGSASSITTSTVTLNGTVSANFNSITATNFNYGTTIGYGSTISGSPSTTSSQSVSISGGLTGLTPNTLYHYRAAATNGITTTNGADSVLTTVSNDPSISGGNNSSAQTSAASTSFIAYWTAPSSQGSASYTYSLDYGTDNTFAVTTTVSGISSASTTYAITGLSSGATYYYRVKVVNAGGSSNYATSGAVPTTATPSIVLAGISSVGAGNIVPSSSNNILTNFSIAVSSANAALTGVTIPNTNSLNASGDVANYKLYYTTTSTFGTGNLLQTVTTSLNATTISFSGFSQSITAGLTGYFWVTTDVTATPTADHNITVSALDTTNLTFSGAVIQSGSVVAQGTQTIINAPTVTTTTVSSISNTTASSGGNVTSEGGTTTTVTRRGLIYSTGSITDTTSTTGGGLIIDAGTGSGSYTSSLTGLTPATLYHVKAFAVNVVGVSYGGDSTFTTYTLPTVTTTTATSITDVSANSGGNVTASGGTTVTRRGLIYSTGAITDTTTTTGGGLIIDAGTGTGSYTSALSSLSNATTYHIMAFAVNSVGVNYGGDSTFTTSASEPATQATAVNFSSIGFTSMTINFTVGSGTNRLVLVKSGSAVSSNPSDRTSYTTNTVFGSGSLIGTGNYVVYNGTGSSVTITGLTAGTTYHVAVYEFSGSGGIENYNITTPATGNQATSNTDFRTATSLTTGNWNSTSTWESFNGSSWVAATATPTSTDGTITIRSGATVTVTANVTADEITINTGGQITVAATDTLIVANGSGTDLTVDGYLKNTGSITMNSGATASVSGTYEHNANGGTVPTATWNTNSTCLVTGITSSTAATGFSQNFYNFTWSCPSQTANLNLGMFNNTIGGNFSFLSAGGAAATETALSNSNAGTGANTITINGNLILNANASNIFGAHRSGSAGTVTTLTVNVLGDFNLTSANLKLQLNNGITNCTWNVYGNFSFAAGTFQSTNASTFHFANNTSHNYTKTGGTYSTSNATMIVDAGSSLNTDTSRIDGTVLFTLNSGCTFTTANVAGGLTTSGTKTLSATANYVFNGTAAQTLSSAITGATDITVNNSAGITLGASVAVTGTLTLTSGKVTLGANTLTLTNAISGASSSNYIVTSGAGLLKRLSAGISGATLFPVGNSSSSYTPLTITNTGTANDLSVASSATITNAVTLSAKIVTLQWTVSSGGAGAVGTIVYNWNVGNQGGSFSNTSAGDLGVYTGSGPYSITSLGTLSGTSITATGVALASGSNLMVIGNTNAVYAAPIVGFDFSTLPGGANLYGTSPYTATTLNANLSSSGIVRGSGLPTTGTAAARGWGAAGNFNSTTSTAAIAANDFATFTVKPNTGYAASLTTISPLNYRTSSTGPDTLLIQYQVNGGSFVDIQKTVITRNTSVGSISAIDLSGISALQSLQSISTVTFRLIPYNATASTGTFYLYDVGASTASDIAINGSVTSCSSTSAAPVITTPLCASSVTLSGTSSEANGTLIDIYLGGTYTTPATTATVTSGAWSTSVSALTSGQVYTAYATASGKCVSTVSSSATVNVLPSVTNFSTSASSPVCIGGTSSVTINSTSLAAATYTVTYNLSGANTATGNTASVTMSSNTGSFNTATLSNSGSTTVTITSIQNAAGCSSALSTGNTASVTVNPTSVGGTAAAASSVVCNGTTTTIGLSGYTGTIQWQQSSNGTSGWASVSGGSGGTTATYTTPTLSAGKYYYRAVVTSGACSSSNSNVDSVTANPTTVAGTAVATSSSVCSGSTTTINLSGSTGTIQWQESANGSTGWANVSGGSGATTATYTTAALTVVNYYRALVTSGVCSADYSGVVSVSILANSWTGGANTTDWSTAGNWCGGVPASGGDITIAASAYTPVLPANTIVGALTLNDTIALGGYKLTINGAVTGNNKVITGSNTSSIEYAATSTSTVNFNQATSADVATTDGTNALADLIVNGSGGSLTLGNKLNLFNRLSVLNGTLNTGGVLVLRSIATNTAYVDSVAGTISGQVLVERYMHHQQRGWRAITAPITYYGLTITDSSNSLKRNWQSAWGYGSGYGTRITGPSTWTPSAPINFYSRGFDDSTVNYSVQTYNSTTGAWGKVTNTWTELQSGNSATAANKSFYIFVRGDRTVTPTTSTPNTFESTTLAAKGLLQTGTQVFNFTGTANKSWLVGNPYACPVDMSKVDLSDAIYDYIYVWDPNITGYSTNTSGNYVTFDKGDWAAGPSTGTNNKYFQSGQAFFVKPTSSSSSITFHEGDKVSSNNTQHTGTMNGSADIFNIKLMSIKGDGSKTEVDGVRAKFGAAYSAAVDANDADKWVTPGIENMSLMRNTKSLVIEARPYILTTDSLFLNMSSLIVGANYEYKVNPINFDASVASCKLVDRFLNTETPISLTSVTTIGFNVTSVAGSSAANRFYVVFNGAGSLPTNGLTVKAYKKNKTVVIDWEAIAENNVKVYNVEKSIDGTNFSKLGEAAAKNANATSEYSLVDNNPVVGVNYYRIKTIQNNSNTVYSKIVRVEMTDKGVKSITVYPNPVKGSTIGIQMSNLEAGVYTARLFNSIGQQIWTNSITHNGNNGSISLDLGKVLAAGSYQISFTDTKGNSFNQSIIVVE